MTIERELVERMARRDASALAELYDGLSGRVYGLALAMLDDPREAEEVVSDTFLQAWRTAGDFAQDRGSVEAWVIAVARSRALDRIRRDRRRAELREGEEHRIAAFTIAEPPPDPEDRGLTRTVLAGPVAEALEALPPEQRRAIELAYLGGLTQREVAEELDVPLGTVKTRIRTGMRSLRVALRPGPEAAGKEGSGR